jgi:sugar phosphate isomerase/epimerase
MRKIIDQVQINIPFVLLHGSYLERFLEERFNPEIGFDAEALDRFSLKELRHVAEIVSERGLRVTFHAPFVDLSPGSPDPEVWRLTRHRYEQVAKLIPLFRPRTVVCHAGFERKRYGYLRDVWFEKSIEMWTWLGDRVHEEGAQLMLENVFEDGPDELQQLFESLDGGKVGFCLDTGHQSAFSSTPLETWIDSLGNSIGQLHLHDNLGSEDEHIALGRGIIDFSTFFRLLRKIVTSPPVVTLEPHREEEVRPSIEFLEQVWPW